MIDFRYHIASLLAIFLALGLGMLIGNSFVGLASAEAQTPLLKRLEQNVAEVREQVQASQQENAALKDQVGNHERALRALAPRVLQGLLSHRRVALVVIGQPEHPETETQLSSLLAAGGAKVLSTTHLPLNWLPRDDAAQSQVTNLLGVPPGETRRFDASRQLAFALVSGRAAETIQGVSRLAPTLSFEGDFTQPVGAVALLVFLPQLTEAQAAQAEDSDLSAYIKTWKNAGLRVVAAEPENAAVSLVAYFRNAGAATVDNVDTALGQVACALALGKGTGDYGVKSTADRLLPDLPSAETTPAPSASPAVAPITPAPG